ncbi:syntaxin-8-like [Hydractinia symbiolongicarpus]|uniref:syntaxin-8-like n=1 Tax=Hydractinia symbiolongicarpus TaxID=13093 RepID=UPI00254B02AF|nr:syntaxin-8-like [Hydractinia symbiolongicarpus]
MAPQESWMRNYLDAEQLGQEIMELINERNSLQRTGSNSARIQSTIRSKLQQFSRDIKDLKDVLMRTSSSSQITIQEATRRQNQLDLLISREKQLNEAFKPSANYNNDFGRSGLLNEGFDREKNNPFGATSRDDRADDITPDKFRTQQQQIIAEQDKGLDALSQVIKRQKLMGQEIGNEIDYQNDLIDEITDGVQNTNQKLIKTDAHTKKVTKKTGSCVLMIIVVLLLIAIIVTAVVPKP